MIDAWKVEDLNRVNRAILKAVPSALASLRPIQTLSASDAAANFRHGFEN